MFGEQTFAQLRTGLRETSERRVERIMGFYEFIDTVWNWTEQLIAQTCYLRFELV